MTTGNHDTLVYRLAQMLVKLNQGGILELQALADEFGVNLRTVQRDLNERFAYLPRQKTEGRYRLDPVFLGKPSTRDIERFACLAGGVGCALRSPTSSCEISLISAFSRSCWSKGTTTRISLARKRYFVRSNKRSLLAGISRSNIKWMTDQSPTQPSSPSI